LYKTTQMMNLVKRTLGSDKNHHRLFLLNRDTDDQIAEQPHLALRIINLHLPLFDTPSDRLNHLVNKRMMDRALFQVVNIMAGTAVDADERFRELAGHCQLCGRSVM